MRIIAASLLLVFFGFNAVLSASVLWQDDDSICIIALQEEEDEEDVKSLKELFLPVYSLLDWTEFTIRRNQTFSIIVDQIVGEVSQNVPYSPPERLNG